METLRGKLTAAAVAVTLLVIGSVMSSRQGVAAGPNDGLAVRIINPLPVPTTGSTTNLDAPGRSPYQVVVSCAGTVSCTASGPEVAPGKRVVIEHVSALIQVATGQPLQFTTLFINGASGDQNLPSHLQNVAITGTKDTYYVNEQVLLYLEAGKNPAVNIQAASGNVVHNTTLTGYVVDLGI